MTDDGWIYSSKKLTPEQARRSRITPDLSFYLRALSINLDGNNHTKGSSGPRYKIGAINSPERPVPRPFNESDTRAKVTPIRDTSKCSIENGEHSGEVGNSFYRDRLGKPHFQVLCELCRGDHWTLVKNLAPDTLRKKRR